MVTGGGDMQVTITDAAQRLGISRQHFYRKYAGKYTAHKQEDGRTLIDLDELARLEPDAFRDVTGDAPPLQPSDTNPTAEVTRLRDNATAMRQALDAASEREAWLREQLEAANRRTDHVLSQLTAAQQLLAWTQRGATTMEATAAEGHQVHETAPATAQETNLEPTADMVMPASRRKWYKLWIA